MWKKYKMSELKPEQIDVTVKRFEGQKTLLYELIDVNRFIVQQYFAKCLTPLAVINKVIVDVKYPFTANNQPTDLHYYQAFRRWLWSCWKTFKNDYDYWQMASETAWLHMGDCEDSSILTGAGLDIKNCPYFVVLGAVYKDWRLLGYHGWTIAKIDNTWRLIETTLDTPYSSIDELTPIDINKNRWKVGEIVYEAMAMFNREELWEWVSGSETMSKLKEYMKVHKKLKENKKKWKALHDNYVKYLGKGIKPVTQKKKKVK